MATRMQQRRGTAAQWTAANPVLAAGEIGFETDTSKFKMGNGSSAWSALQYFANASELAALIDNAPAALNTLNELAAAIGDDADFIGTVTAHTTASTNVHGIANTADLSTKSFATAAANDFTVAHNLSTTLVHGIADTSVLATQTDISDTEDYADSAVSAHASVSTNVHGIDDFSLLAKTSEVTDAIGDAVDYHNSLTVNVHGIADTAELATTSEVTDAISNAIGLHVLVTENVHGIADTAELATASDVTDAINNFSSVTTDIHGIANTANLATQSYVSTAIQDLATSASVTSAISDFSAITTNIHGIADTVDLATKDYADDAVSDHNLGTLNVHGIADTADLATQDYVTTEFTNNLGTHVSDSQNVHGIADTSLLATTSYVDTAVGNSTVDQSLLAGTGIDWNTGTEQFDIDSTVATKTYADTAVSDHNADTTNVHGIADTSLLATKSYADTAEADAIAAAGTAADSKIATAVAALTKSSVGLANVDNTSDANKPVSTATQTALDAKASLAGATFTGSVEIDQNLTVDGNLTVNGTTFNASSTSITIEDNMVQLAHQNAANTVDLGIVVGYNDGSAKHAGLVRDVSDAKWKLFKGVTTEPSTTVDFTQGSLDDLKVAAFEATTVTASSGIVFSDGTQTKEGVPSRTPIVQKTASYSLSQLTHRDSMIEVDSTSATTLTIPLDSTVNYPVGTTIDILQTNTGQVTIAPVSGSVTVNATPGLKLRTRWSSATLMKRAANTWVVYGDLTA
jgi:hypothetical protein